VVSLKSILNPWICGSLCWLGTLACAEAQDFPIIQKLYPDDAEVFPSGEIITVGFGTHLALDGNTLMASEPESVPPRVVVFTRSGASAPWTRTATVYISTAPSYLWDYHSSKLALDGDIALIGSPRTVHVLHRVGRNWQEIQRIKPPSPDGVQSFPRTLAFDGGVAVITGASSTEGIAYVYEAQPSGRLALKARLRSLTGSPGDGFGESAALHSGTIAIGAPGVKSVFVFKRSGSTWKRIQQVMPVEVGSAQTFGTAVAVDGNTLVVGAPEALSEGNEGERQNGAAYVFGLSEGAYAQKSVLHPEEYSGYTDYGRIVKLTSDRLLVSAVVEHIDGPYYGPGLSFTYTRSGSAVHLLGVASDDFDPWDMVTDGTQLVVSDGGFRYAIGSAYVFDIRKPN